MVLYRPSRVCKMRLHKLHSIRNKSVIVLRAGSTWLIPILLAALEHQSTRLGYFPLLHRAVALLFGSPFLVGHHEAIASWPRLHLEKILRFLRLTHFPNFQLALITRYAYRKVQVKRGQIQGESLVMLLSRYFHRKKLTIQRQPLVSQISLLRRPSKGFVTPQESLREMLGR